MTIALTITAFQTLNATISGVTTAPTAYPTTINTADLPLVITWPGPAETYLEGLGYNVVQRRYRVSCYVDAIEQGLGINEAWQSVITILQAFHTAYLASTNNPLVNNGTYQSSIRNSEETPIPDGGLEVIAYPPPATGQAGYPHYYGFQMEVLVKEEWSGS